MIAVEVDDKGSSCRDQVASDQRSARRAEKDWPAAIVAAMDDKKVSAEERQKRVRMSVGRGNLCSFVAFTGSLGRWLLLPTVGPVCRLLSAIPRIVLTSISRSTRLLELLQSVRQRLPPPPALLLARLPRLVGHDQPLPL